MNCLIDSVIIIVIMLEKAISKKGKTKPGIILSEVLLFDLTSFRDNMFFLKVEINCLIYVKKLLIHTQRQSQNSFGTSLILAVELRKKGNVKMSKY